MNTEYFSSINDVSTRLGVPAHTLRYWEKQFPAAIKPTTGAGGRRYYRPETVDMLIKIKDLLYSRGMTINGVKKMLKDGALRGGSEFKVQSSDAPAQSGPLPAAAPASPVTPLAESESGLFTRGPEIAQAIDLLTRARAVLAD
jgi:DNA-binding transcriptional MerR regulator